MYNIDHNPTATTACTSFHGTSISVVQYQTEDNQGETSNKRKQGKNKVKTVPEPPDSFTNIRPAYFTQKNPTPPHAENQTIHKFGLRTPPTGHGV
jgi:hypothetical protein